MKKKTWILTGLAAIIMASFILFIGFSSHASAKKEKSTSCVQKTSTGSGVINCKTRGLGSGQSEMVLDHLSRQLLFINLLGY